MSATDLERQNWHQIAHSQWLPFLGALLTTGIYRGGDPKRASTVQVPKIPAPPMTAEVGALHHHAVENAREIIVRAVGRFLWRDIGWRRMSAVCSEGGDVGWKSVRLWEISTPSPEFTAESIDLLVRVFNATRGGNSVADLRNIDPGPGSGDLLLHHLVFRNLQKHRHLEDCDWTAWFTNPLNVAFAAPDRKLVACNWERLIAPDLAFALPWLLEDWGMSWSAATRDVFYEMNTKLIPVWFDSLDHISSSIRDLIVEAERPSWLVPLLGWLHRESQFVSDDVSRFLAMSAGLSLREQSSRSVPWTQFLGQGGVLEGVVRDVQSVHPIERDAEQSCLIAEWEKLGVGAAFEVLNTAREQLSPSFG